MPVALHLRCGCIPQVDQRERPQRVMSHLQGKRPQRTQCAGNVATCMYAVETQNSAEIAEDATAAIVQSEWMFHPRYVVVTRVLWAPHEPCRFSTVQCDRTRYTVRNAHIMCE